MTIVRRSEETILQFIATIKRKYPELTEQQILEICKAPYKLVAYEMKQGNLTNIRIKYLGNFVVYPGRVKGNMRKITKLFEEKKINQEMFDNFRTRTENYFNNQTEGHGKDSLD